jgi:hypothetical protein
MRLKTLYVSDLDGTLLDASSRVSDESLRILNDLIAKGAMFTVATARTQATVQPMLQNLLPAKTPAGLDIPAIIMTGAGYWNRRLERLDYLRMMSDSDVEIVLREFRRAGVEPFQYCAESDRCLSVYHAAGLTPREDAFYQERRSLELKTFHIGEENPDLPTVLFFAMGEADKMEQICRGINSKTRCSAAWYRDIFNPEVALMDVYCAGCSKAVAIKDVAEELGADRIVVFGDNLNDLPMMRVADLSVAVENALPQVKAEADIVIGPNTLPSVANFVREDFYRAN